MAAILESLSALASPPSVIADTIARASTAARPRTRYVAGRGARTIITARQLLPDRAFDALITSGYHLAGNWPPASAAPPNLPATTHPMT
jgi:hypothetical protein